MFDKIKRILPPDEVKATTSLSAAQQKIKLSRDAEIRNIISGQDKRFLVVIGPCSSDNEDSVCDYVARLAKVSDKISSKVLIVPRIYTNKPRTRGEGYKGMLHQPVPTKETDIQEGIYAIRRMHIRAISESGLTSADEMLYPDNLGYVDDLLSYITVGARSTENQQHRLVASGIEVPVGIKNPMNGSIPVMLNSIYAAQISNEFKYLEYQVKTCGNKYAHAVLRGAVDLFGNNIPNYHYEDVLKVSELYQKSGLSNPSVIIDTNHSNSDKKPLEQVRIVREVLTNYRHYKDFAKFVKGFMIESYIEDGNQPAGGAEYGKSITDGCLGWAKTEKLLYEIAEKI